MARKPKNKKNGIHGKIFINLGGETLLCLGRLKFLEAVDQMGSITAAAKKMGYSYRKAWSMVERTNRAAGRVIIETKSGGTHGGGAYLTGEGRKLAMLYREFLDENQRMTDEFWRRFCEAFDIENDHG